MGDMYDLHKLGWHSFQQLCHTIAGEILGQTVEQFLDPHDGGRDGAFFGEWTAAGHENFSGPLVIQCKFTSKADYVLKASDISEEFEKAQRLVEGDLCETYVLMTNAGLTGMGEEEIRKRLIDAGVKHIAIYGSTWINRQIRESQRLRMLVPRVYGLGDLSQILDERAYEQANALLDTMRDDLAKVIITDSYRRAVRAINDHRFVLLIGEPATGKTTIASLLAMAALDQGTTSVLSLDSPVSVVEHWNPSEPSQFFWLDDAFGVTQYEDSLVRAWNHILPRVDTMLSRGARMIMTSRDYIYNHAREYLKESAFPRLNESQVVIDVHDLSIEDKEEILYNHIKFGNQPRDFRKEIKPYLEGAARNPRFIPEIARRLGDKYFTKGLKISESGVSQFIENREGLLREILQGLDTDSKAALALIFMRNGHLDSPIILKVSEEQALVRLGGELGKCIDALEAMKDSLVTFSYQGSEATWQFRHPTIGDAYAGLVSQSPEHIGIFIQGSSAQHLTGQVTCGDVGYENATIVTNHFFPQMTEKLDDLLPGKFDDSGYISKYTVEHDLLEFLSRRCSKDFLSFYMDRNSEHLERFSKPAPPLLFNPEVDFIVRLYELGILPEEWRRNFVRRVTQYATLGYDGSALTDSEIRKLFTLGESEELAQKIQIELLPRLDDVRMDWESEWDAEMGAPEDHVQPLMDYFTALKEEFSNDQSAIQLVCHETAALNQWVEDLNSWEPGEEYFSEEFEAPIRQQAREEVLVEVRGKRSIFDDIDASADP